MKKFIITRFGFNNCTTDWFDYHIKLWEALTLPCLEKNVDEDTYILMVVSEMIPLSSMRLLNNVIKSSSARGNIHILKFMPSFDGNVWNPAAKFVSEVAQVEVGEYFLIQILDSDDGIRTRFIDEAMNYVLEKFREKGEHRCVLCYPEGATFYLDNNKLYSWYYEYIIMNIFIVTNDIKHISMIHNLHSMALGNAEKACEHLFFKIYDFSSYIAYNGQVNWFYTIHSKSSEGFLRRDSNENLRHIRNGKLGDELCCNILESEGKFSVNFRKLLSLQNNNQMSQSFFGTYHIKSNSVLNKLSDLRKDYDALIDIYRTLIDYNDLEKIALRNWFEQKKKISYNDYYSILCEFYNYPQNKSDILAGLDNGQQMLETLSNKADMFRVFIASSGIGINYCADIDRGIIRFKTDMEQIVMRVPISVRGKDILLKSHVGHSSIFTQGMEWSLDKRGLNFLITDSELNLIDVFNIDVCDSNMPLIR